ncbi:LysE/ArgO family amino acid transporter [Streptomyces thermolilacinus]|uniref:LysE/ArgO family amino acid transporter n=1 Tax=Streptomyces thermolilacinus TaxID=285540 RepID=UPI0033CDC59B
MIGALVAGAVAGWGIAVPVGAVGAYLVAVTARTSWRVGACAALGVATADGLYALVAMAGGSVLVPLLEPVMLPLRWASALVLVALAVKGAVTALVRYRAQQGAVADGERRAFRPGRAYLVFLGITLLNPMTIVYFAALVIGGGSAGRFGVLERALFVVAAFVASAGWQLFLAGGGALLGRRLTSARGRLVTALVSSTLITGLAVHLLLTA